MRFSTSGDKHFKVIRSFGSKEIGAAGARPVAYPEGIVNPPCSLDSRSMVWHPSCSGLRTIIRGLANTGFGRPALGANTRPRRPTLSVNESTLMCEGLVNRRAGQHAVRTG